MQRPALTGGNGIAANLQVADLLDTMSVRVIPEKALGAPFTVAMEVSDMQERHLITIANGVMIHEKGVTDKADATLIVPRLALIGMIGGQAKAIDLIQAGTLQIAGDPAVLQRFLGVFAPPRAGFPLVTPLDTK